VGGIRRSVPGLAGRLDFLAVNYYTRWRVRMFSPEPRVARRSVPRTDLGWEVDAPGFETALRRAGKLGVPVLVAENGFADAHDRLRPRALVDHLTHMHRAIQAGVPVVGYLHWSLMDNFEWADGYRGRFGLYQVDFADPERPRRRTRSAELYARVCRANALGPEVMAEAGVAM
jgi:beta-glucosidase